MLKKEINEWTELFFSVYDARQYVRRIRRALTYGQKSRKKFWKKNLKKKKKIWKKCFTPKKPNVHLR